MFGPRVNPVVTKLVDLRRSDLEPIDSRLVIFDMLGQFGSSHIEFPIAQRVDQSLVALDAQHPLRFLHAFAKAAEKDRQHISKGE